MIFDHLNFKNKFLVEKIENNISIVDSTNNYTACSIALNHDKDVLWFDMTIDDKYIGAVNEMAYSILIEHFVLSKISKLQTMVECSNPNIEYLHSHNFSMMSVNDKFKLTYAPRNYDRTYYE